MDAFFCEAGHPRRPVAWRWRRAVDLVRAARATRSTRWPTPSSGRRAPFGSRGAAAVVTRIAGVWPRSTRSSSRATNFIVGGGAALPAPCGRGSSRVARPKPSPGRTVWRSRSSPCFEAVVFSTSRDRLLLPRLHTRGGHRTRPRLSAGRRPLVGAGAARLPRRRTGRRRALRQPRRRGPARARPRASGRSSTDRLRAAVAARAGDAAPGSVGPWGRPAALRAGLLERWASARRRQARRASGSGSSKSTSRR